MKEEQKKKREHDVKFQLAGWMLFIVCAVFYIVSSLIHRDVWTFVGSVIFLMACILFLVPVFKKRDSSRD